MDHVNGGLNGGLNGGQINGGQINGGQINGGQINDTQSANAATQTNDGTAAAVAASLLSTPNVAYFQWLISYVREHQRSSAIIGLSPRTRRICLALLTVALDGLDHEARGRIEESHRCRITCLRAMGYLEVSARLDATHGNTIRAIQQIVMERVSDTILDMLQNEQGYLFDALRANPLLRAQLQLVPMEEMDVLL
ncbi:hypothetical protein ACRALDRAFT_1067913 [Sodiomyces alcalophilus JCM 7366]|uniref:uncharacterized protein n=1 Tax=Sodiomyces alcalophilus JCM 7366 TaxID=591952 RepID=UPI0039B47195